MDPIVLLLFAILFLLSWFFSGTEIALMGLPSHKVDSLVKQGLFGANALKYIKERNDKLLSTILIGNNLVNTFTATFATVIATWLAQSAGIKESVAIWLSTWVVTFLLLVFGEIVPKSFATKNAEKISLTVAPIYKFLLKILAPVNYILEMIIKVFTGSAKIQKISEEEIEAFIDFGRESWSLWIREHDKIKNILDFWETTAEEVMTPRVNVEMISDTATVKEAIEFFLQHTHSRIPIYGKTIDKVKYFVTIRELLKEKEAWNKDKTLKELEFRKILKVPVNQPISSILDIFRNARKHVAIVVDEYGWVAGLLTIEDILEEIVWEIRDETDKEEDEVQKIGKNSVIIESKILFEELLENFDLQITDLWFADHEYDGETVSFVITDILERFPNPGETISFKVKLQHGEGKIIKKNLNLKVSGITDGKIDKVEVVLI
jgi:putative hemolysin